MELPVKPYRYSPWLLRLSPPLSAPDNEPVNNGEPNRCRWAALRRGAYRRCRAIPACPILSTSLSAKDARPTRHPSPPTSFTHSPSPPAPPDAAIVARRWSYRSVGGTPRFRRNDRRAEMIVGEPEGINEVLRVRSKCSEQLVNVCRHRTSTLCRQATPQQVPGEILLEQTETVEIAEPSDHLACAQILDFVHSLGECLPHLKFTVRTSDVNELRLVSIREDLNISTGSALRGTPPRWGHELNDHAFEPPCEQRVLCGDILDSRHGPGERSAVDKPLTEPAHSQLLKHIGYDNPRHVPDGPGQTNSVDQCGVTGYQLLCNQL